MSTRIGPGSLGFGWVVFVRAGWFSTVSIPRPSRLVFIILPVSTKELATENNILF
jgi:hypothetical protein